MTIIVLIIGFFAGILSGLFGIGGGVVIVPLLIFLARFSQIEANGASLAGLLLPVGLFAVMTYHKKHLIDIKASALIALGLILGSYFGSILALNLPATALKRAYGIFLFYVSYRFIDPIAFFKKSQSHHDHKKTIKPLIRYSAVLITGIVAGFASGLFGIGGAAIIIPVLVGLLGYGQKEAGGTSLGALLLPVGLPGVIAYYKSGHINLFLGGMLALGLLTGAFFGAKLAIKLPSKIVKQLYGFLLLIIALLFIFR